jgi:hypothetical protein
MLCDTGVLAGQTVVAQPVHVQQLLKLKQQAVQQQKAIQPQVAQSQTAVQQKVRGPPWGFSWASGLRKRVWSTQLHQAKGPQRMAGLQGKLLWAQSALLVDLCPF